MNLSRVEKMVLFFCKSFLKLLDDHHFKVCKNWDEYNEILEKRKRVQEEYLQTGDLKKYKESKDSIIGFYIEESEVLMVEPKRLCNMLMDYAHSIHEKVILRSGIIVDYLIKHYMTVDSDEMFNTPEGRKMKDKFVCINLDAIKKFIKEKEQNNI